MIPVSGRPQEATDRSIPGYWEGDLIQDSRNACFVTLVEHHSRFILQVKTWENKTITVIPLLTKQALELSVHFYKTLIWVYDAEMFSNARFTAATDTQIYVSDPQSRWQRGSNESTNRLPRKGAE